MITTHAVPNPPEFQDVPEIRLRGDDMDRLFGIFAAEAELERACKDEKIRRRFQALKNGWRDLRCAQGILSRLVGKVQWTIPYEKRVGFERAAGRCRYVVMQGPLAVKPKPDEQEIIAVHELDELVASAWEWRCRVCEGDCDRCSLGRVLDTVVAKDRDGGSWSTIDVTRKT